jgi:hypothetical protein
LFVNFKVAYDSVKRSRLYEAMEEFGIPWKLIRMTKMTMMQVRVQSFLVRALKDRDRETHWLAYYSM